MIRTGLHSVVGVYATIWYHHHGTTMGVSTSNYLKTLAIK
jgi:hypothetical protein